MNEKPSATLPGTVEKIIKSPIPDEPEKAQIAVEGADHHTERYALPTP
jgi:hypothetical protein